MIRTPTSTWFITALIIALAVALIIGAGIGFYYMSHDPVMDAAEKSARADLAKALKEEAKPPVPDATTMSCSTATYNSYTSRNVRNLVTSSTAVNAEFDAVDKNEHVIVTNSCIIIEPIKH